MNISGGLADINATGNLTFSAFGTLGLTFDAGGISTVDVGGSLTLNSGSTLTINGSAYSGPRGQIILVNAGSLANTFTNVNITGFGGGMGHLR